MAGTSRTVQIQIVGDSTKAQRSFNDLAKKGDDTGEHLKGAFDGALGMLNKTGILGPFGDSLDEVGRHLDGLGKKGDSFVSKMSKISLAVTGISLGLAALGSGEMQAQAALKAAVEATPSGSWTESGEEMEKAAKSGEKYRYSVKETTAALTNLTVGLNDPQKAADALGVTMQMAAFKHQSVAQSASDYVKIMGGNTKLLKAYGITMKDTTTEQKTLTDAQRSYAEAQQRYNEKTTKKPSDRMTLEDAQKRVADAQAAFDKANSQPGRAFTPEGAIDLLTQRTAGQAEARRAGPMGQLGVLETKVEDKAAAFGAKHGGALAAGGFATNLAMMALMAKSMRAVAAAAPAAEAGMSAVAGAELIADAAAAPLLLTYGLLAIGAIELGIIGYELYTHWDTIWAGMKKAPEAILHVLENVGEHIVNFVLAPINAVMSLLNKLDPFGDPFHEIHPFAHAAGARGAVPMAIPAAGAAGGGDLVVHSHVHLDARQVGYGVAKHSRTQLLRDQRGTVNTGLA